jgi:hypothetical protein
MKKTPRAYTKRTSKDLAQAIEETSFILNSTYVRLRSAYGELKNTPEWVNYRKLTGKQQYYKRKLDKLIDAVARKCL